MMYYAELSEEQIRVINEALELYSRLLIGQVNYIREIFPYSKDFDYKAVDNSLRVLKTRLFPGMSENSSYGIHSPEVNDKARVAWDIQQVFRHRLSWDCAGNPSTRNFSTMMGVNYDDPMRSSNKHELCKIRQKPSEEDFLEGK